MTRFWLFLGTAILSGVFGLVSAEIRHPIKAELWIVAAVVLLVLAIAEKVEL